MNKHPAITQAVFKLSTALSHLGCASVFVCLSGPQEAFSPDHKINIGKLPDGGDLLFQTTDVDGPIETILIIHHIPK